MEPFFAVRLKVYACNFTEKRLQSRFFHVNFRVKFAEHLQPTASQVSVIFQKTYFKNLKDSAKIDSPRALFLKQFFPLNAFHCTLCELPTTDCKAENINTKPK